ncbi:hypothetical protein EKK58_09660 [Candidatus Dependentiae bacterium]|nr:MAG: hypothetical protein EKK58_09660 [Candidatus Dependentiae bacterium]
MHMIEPDRFVLNDSDEQYYLQLQKAYHLVFDELRESVAMKAIMEQVPGADTWHRANRILRDIYALFSPFVQKNKDLRRAILLEKLYMMADVAQKNAVYKYEAQDAEGNKIEKEGADLEWMELAGKLYAQAAKIEGLDQPEVIMLNPDEITIPAIEVTSDPQAFLAAQADIEDADYDEWPDDQEEDDPEEAEEHEA